MRTPRVRRGWWLLPIIALLAGGIILALIVYAVWVEPNRVVVEEVEVPIADLPAALDGLRIVHVSDLHTTGAIERERKAAALIRQLAPDMILVSGDLIQHTVRLDVQEAWSKAAGEWLGSLGKPPFGVWVSRGNADISRYGSFNNAFVTYVQAAGAQILFNEARPIMVGGSELWLAGADYPELRDGFTHDFAVAADEKGRWVETGQSSGESTLHWWDKKALSWSNYEYTGRLARESAAGGIGVTFYSRWPEGFDQYYYLRMYKLQPTLHIAKHGGKVELGDVDTGVVPAPGRWYSFRVRVESDQTATRIRARVWPDGEPEPAGWQADCLDRAPGHLSGGTVGLWGLEAGRKRFDDLLVRPLDETSEPLLEERFEATPIGRRPEGWLAYGVVSGNVRQALSQVPPNAPVILVAHSPDQLWEAVGKNVLLVVAGHTHGGQVRLPLIGPLYVPTKLGRRYASGLHQVGGVWLYVNRGIGMRSLPVRFLCSPEVTLLVLKRGEPSF